MMYRFNRLYMWFVMYGVLAVYRPSLWLYSLLLLHFLSFYWRLSHYIVKNIGTLSVQELFFQLIGLLGLRLGVSPVGMVELFVHGASLTT